MSGSILRPWLKALATFLVPALALVGCTALPAPRPLYDDPVWHGAADAAVVYHRGLQRWEMFYTARRATLRLADAKDVSWVHGTRIGIAAAASDGNTWRHVGEAVFPQDCTGGAPEQATHWAPEIVDDGRTYHLWLTVVPGIHSRWTGARHIQHLSSTDLRQWQCEERLDLGSERVIDASVVRLADGHWRLWYKDEAGGSRLKYADSSDLRRWTLRGPVSALAAEGPKVFRFAGQWWLVADLWRGLLVLRSDDAEHWTEQPTRLLAEPGRHASDRAKGQHADVQVVGEQLCAGPPQAQLLPPRGTGAVCGDRGPTCQRAYLFYFVHQSGEDEARGDDRHHQRSVIQVAELHLQDGWLRVDRDAPPPDLRQAFGPGKH